MTTQKDILLEVKGLLDELVNGALQLKETSTQAISNEEIDSIQNRQEELLETLLKLDTDFQKKFNQTINDLDLPICVRIKEQINTFKKLNETFMTNLKVLKGLVQIELQNLKKAAQGLSELKSVYGVSNKKKKSRHINTVR